MQIVAYLECEPVVGTYDYGTKGHFTVPFRFLGVGRGETFSTVIVEAWRDQLHEGTLGAGRANGDIYLRRITFEKVCSR